MGNNTNVPTEEQINGFVKMFKKGENLTKIGKYYGFSANTVKSRLKQREVFTPQKKISTPDLDKKIIKLYKQLNSSRQVAEELNCSKWMVIDILKKHNIEYNEPSSYRKYTNDSTFFDSIDTSEKAYWLGVLFADGYNNESEGSIALQNSESDKDLPYGLKKALKATNKIYIRNPKGNRQKIYVIKIYDKHLSKTLARLGCCQNKTDKLKYPDISQQFNRDFIRGYFDGDGSVWFRNDPKYKISYRKFVSITSCTPFLEEIQAILINEAGLSKTKIAVYKKKPGFGDLRWGGVKYPKLFADYIYYKDCICLKRKFDKLKQE